jgi:DNA-binding NtrC family response regulator
MKMVLVVDDKELMRDSVAATLERAGFTIATASDAAAALEQIARKRPDAVVSDLKMPNMDGIELVEKIRALDEDLPVVLMTAFGTIETAVRAMKTGAFDYLTKPFEGDELIIAVKRAIEHGRLLKENAVLRANEPQAAARTGEVAADRGLDRLIGSAECMRKLRDQLGAIAASHGTVLVNGESGVGKEVVARAIHEMSPRADGPFLAVNCAALSESLLESELFGHERGAFTGADKLRKGRFELADGGTLLLDEVSEISPQIQAKLLRVLQERTFERVGSSTSIGVDVRVIATSNRDLSKSIEKGEFRQDLYFRLSVLPVNVPPLRARGEDAPLLAEHFTRQICKREGRDDVRFTSDAMELLRQYAWPGNVRELQNICERAVVLSGAITPAKREIGADLIAPWLTGAGSLPGTHAVAMASGAIPGSASVVNVAGSQSYSIVETKPGGSLGNGVYANGNSHGFGNGPASGASLSAATAGSTNGHAVGYSNGTTTTASTGSVPVTEGGHIRQLEDIERDVIIQTLTRLNGHRQRTAHALGIGVRTLGLKLKKWKELQLVSRDL